MTRTITSTNNVEATQWRKEREQQYFGRKDTEDQEDAMENGKLNYEGHTHFSFAKKFFRINNQLEYLGTDVKKLSEKDMAKKRIAKTLHPVE